MDTIAAEIANIRDDANVSKADAINAYIRDIANICDNACNRIIASINASIREIANIRDNANVSKADAIDACNRIIASIIDKFGDDGCDDDADADDNADAATDADNAADTTDDKRLVASTSRNANTVK